MGDVVFVATIIAFFAVAVAYVGACARVVGDDEPGPPAAGTPAVGADEPAPSAGADVSTVVNR